MDFAELLVQVIDTRSFSSLWYWTLLALAWSQASHWVIGVPYDAILRARRQGGEALADLEDLARIHAGRLLQVARSAGLWLLAAAAFLLTVLAVLGFWYGVELAQALAFLLLPFAPVAALSIRAARGIEAEAARGEALVARLLRHRRAVQAVGTAAIFVSALYGMWHNLAALRGF